MQEWWYNSIIAHDYDSMKACMDFCEKDANCGACDYWSVADQCCRVEFLRQALNADIISFFLSFFLFFVFLFFSFSPLFFGEFFIDFFL